MTRGAAEEARYGVDVDTASTFPELPQGEWRSDEPQMETFQHADRARRAEAEVAKLKGG
jgi:hypothetical protein